MAYYAIHRSTDDLYHHGIKGMKWGVRRFQNEDGSLTSAGKQRYSVGEAKQNLKNARRERTKADYEFAKAFNRASGAGQYARMLTKKGREENKRRDQAMRDRLSDYDAKDKAYKQAKSEYKQAKLQSKIDKTESKAKNSSFKSSQVTNAYKAAKLKAKQDPSYKNSAEYKAARDDNARVVTERLLLGYVGTELAERYRKK